MANYWGKSPLRMECPHCGQRDEHSVVRTDPSNYHWSDELAPLFERLVGRDISYRRRTKRCKSCDREFLTVEWRTYISAPKGSEPFTENTASHTLASIITAEQV